MELNRAVAVAIRDGPLAGLTLVDAILARSDPEDYFHAHASRADLYRPLGKDGRGSHGLRRGSEACSPGTRATVYHKETEGTDVLRAVYDIRGHIHGHAVLE